MSKNNYQSLNYTSQAIDSITNSPVYQTIINSPYPGAISYLLNLLEKSVKFMLPNRGEILESFGTSEQASFKQEWVDLMYLPFPISVFEIPFEYEPGEHIEQIEGLNTQVPSPKRIALCWNPKAHDADIQAINNIIKNESKFFKFEETDNTYIIGDENSPDGFCLVVLYFDTSTNQWEHTPAGGFFPYSLNIGRSDYNNTLLAKPINIFPTLLKFLYMHQHNFNMEQTLNQVWHDIGYETWAILQSLCVLNCQNIEAKNIEVPEKIQKNRMKKGLKPLYTYKVLQVKAHGIGYSSKNSNEPSHNKSTHLRRGHLRRLSSDKTIYVRATIVGKSEQSIVEKDYLIASSHNQK